MMRKISTINKTLCRFKGLETESGIFSVMMLLYAVLEKLCTGY